MNNIQYLQITIKLKLSLPIPEVAHTLLIMFYSLSLIPHNVINKFHYFD